jgi:hypothetical protein
MPRSISGSIAPVVKIVLLDETQRRFEAEDEWWREHRDAKELFVEEFAQTLDQLASMPSKGQRYRLTRGKLIQRALMKRRAAMSTTSTTASEILSRFTRSGALVESAARSCSDVGRGSGSGSDVDPIRSAPYVLASERCRILLGARARQHRTPRRSRARLGRSCAGMRMHHGLGLPGLIRDQVDQQIVSKISSLKRNARRAADGRFKVPVGADQSAGSAAGSCQ